MHFKAVIFDLDGVICFTDEYHYRAWKALADKLNTPFDRTINNRLRGVSRMASLEIILERYTGPALSEEEKLALATEKNEIYRESLKEMSTRDLSDEVRQTLDALRAKGLLLAIGSSSKNTPFILHQIGLDNYFDAISDGNNITHSKPDPEVFLKAAEFVGVDPAYCLVVEDAVSGAEAGHRAGMKSPAWATLRATARATGTWGASGSCWISNNLEKYRRGCYKTAPIFFTGRRPGSCSKSSSR